MYPFFAHIACTCDTWLLLTAQHHKLGPFPPCMLMLAESSYAPQPPPCFPFQAYCSVLRLLGLLGGALAGRAAVPFFWGFVDITLEDRFQHLNLGIGKVRCVHALKFNPLLAFVFGHLMVVWSDFERKHEKDQREGAK